MNRRLFFQNAFAVAATWIAGGSGLFHSMLAHATSRPDAAFVAKDLDSVLMEVLGTTEPVPISDQIKLEAPLQAENGAVVPIIVSTTLPAPESIVVLVPKNPTPLLTVLETTQRTGSFFKIRIKMAGTDMVVAYVRSGDQWYRAEQEVRVAVGGCGG